MHLKLREHYDFGTKEKVKRKSKLAELWRVHKELQDVRKRTRCSSKLYDTLFVNVIARLLRCWSFSLTCWERTWRGTGCKRDREDEASRRGGIKNDEEGQWPSRYCSANAALLAFLLLRAPSLRVYTSHGGNHCGNRRFLGKKNIPVPARFTVRAISFPCLLFLFLFLNPAKGWMKPILRECFLPLLVGSFF